MILCFFLARNQRNKHEMSRKVVLSFRFIVISLLIFIVLVQIDLYCIIFSTSSFITSPGGLYWRTDMFLIYKLVYHSQYHS